MDKGMRDMFTAIKDDLAELGIEMEVLVRRPGETAEEFEKRCLEEDLR